MTDDNITINDDGSIEQKMDEGIDIEKKVFVHEGIPCTVIEIDTSIEEADVNKMYMGMAMFGRTWKTLIECGAFTDMEIAEEMLKQKVDREIAGIGQSDSYDEITHPGYIPKVDPNPGKPTPPNPNDWGPTWCLSGSVPPGESVGDDDEVIGIAEQKFDGSTDTVEVRTYGGAGVPGVQLASSVSEEGDD